MQVLIEGGGEVLIFLFPFELVLIQSEGVGEYLFPEHALVLEMLFPDGLLVLLKVLIFDLILVADGLKMDFFAGLPQRLFVGEERVVGLGKHSWLTEVVASSHNKEHLLVSVNIIKSNI